MEFEVLSIEGIARDEFYFARLVVLAAFGLGEDLELAPAGVPDGFVEFTGEIFLALVWMGGRDEVVD